MPYEAVKHGEYTLLEAVTGKKGYEIPGGSGICTVCTVIWTYTNPEGSESFEVAIIGYPGNVGDDGIGEASALRTFLQEDPPDTHIWTPGPIDTEAEGGWLGLTFRMDINGVSGGIAELTLTCTMLDSTVPEDFPGTDGPNAPGIPNDGLAPDVDLTDPERPIVSFTTLGDEDGAVVERSKVGGEFPWDIAGTTTTGEFEDNLTDNGFDKAPGTFTYRIRTFLLDTPDGPALSEPTEPTESFTYPESENEVNITGDLVLDLDWQSTMIFLTDPSGIYTLVEGQRYDRLYNRGGESFVDVKIPNPFIKLGPVR